MKREGWNLPGAAFWEYRKRASSEVEDMMQDAPQPTLKWEWAPKKEENGVAPRPAEVRGKKGRFSRDEGGSRVFDSLFSRKKDCWSVIPTEKCFLWSRRRCFSSQTVFPKRNQIVWLLREGSRLATDSPGQERTYSCLYISPRTVEHSPTVLCCPPPLPPFPPSLPSPPPPFPHTHEGDCLLLSLPSPRLLRGSSGSCSAPVWARNGWGISSAYCWKPARSIPFTPEWFLLLYDLWLVSSILYFLHTFIAILALWLWKQNQFNSSWPTPHLCLMCHNRRHRLCLNTCLKSILAFSRTSMPKHSMHGCVPVGVMMCVTFLHSLLPLFHTSSFNCSFFLIGFNAFVCLFGLCETGRNSVQDTASCSSWAAP